MGSFVNSPEQPSPRTLQRQTRWSLQVASVSVAFAQGVMPPAGCREFPNGVPTANDVEIIPENSIETMWAGLRDPRCYRQCGPVFQMPNAARMGG